MFILFKSFRNVGIINHRANSLVLWLISSHPCPIADRPVQSLYESMRVPNRNFDNGCFGNIAKNISQFDEFGINIYSSQVVDSHLQTFSKLRGCQLFLQGISEFVNIGLVTGVIHPESSYDQHAQVQKLRCIWLRSDWPTCGAELERVMVKRLKGVMESPE